MTCEMSCNLCCKISKQLEEVIQRDEGQRGIKEILTEELYLASKLLLASDVIAITTGAIIYFSRINLQSLFDFILGFPCLVDFSVPTETDGPMGALAIARSCLVHGKKVYLLTDECNEDVLLAAILSSDLVSYQHDSFFIHSFPPKNNFDNKDERRLNEIMNDIDLVIAIERPGPNFEEKYLTMSKRDMTHLIAPLDMLFRQDNIYSIGIGDGGNEIGMGKVYDKIINSSILNAETIACIVPSTFLIVSSVSNWGGYALAICLTILSTCKSCNEDNYIEVSNYSEFLNSCVPTTAQEITICQSMIDAGARDGITKSNELMVDGFELSVSLDILNKLKSVALANRQFE